MNAEATWTADDAALAVLDEPKKMRRKRSASGRHKPTNSITTEPIEIDAAGPVHASEFDLEALDQAESVGPESIPSPPIETAVSKKRGSRRHRHRKDRLRRSQRREIILAVAMSALVMFVFVVLALTGSCTTVAPGL